MNVIDGKSIALSLKERLKTNIASFTVKPVLAILIVGENPIIETYVRMKQKTADDLGIETKLVRIADGAEQSLIESTISELNEDKEIHGFIIQLPLPQQYDTQKLLNCIASAKDVDLLNDVTREKYRTGDTKMTPPVVGAFQEIINSLSLNLSNKAIVVLGKGRLVGAPTVDWLMREGYDFSVFDKDSGIDFEILKNADLVISGIGSSHFIKPHMVKDGVIIFDAGTTSIEKTVLGDVDPATFEKASLITPVPGGVGPLTVVKLLENVSILVAENLLR